jgi:hypothetical protein
LLKGDTSMDLDATYNSQLRRVEVCLEEAIELDGSFTVTL